MPSLYMNYRNVAIRASRKGGAIALRYFETSVEREVKADKSFVTIADKKAEVAIMREIKKYFPDHGILSEESGETAGDSKYQWVIDPIDGTANFINGIPLFAVSIALLEDGIPIVGVIYGPAGDSLYVGERGKGVRWNGKKVKVSDGKSKDALITFGPGRRDKERLNTFFFNAENFVKSKRYLGCAALDLAYVARGGTEGFVCLGLKQWDYAAGVLLVEEAGGKITDFSGKPWVFGSDDYFVASNKKIHGALLNLVRSVARIHVLKE